MEGYINLAGLPDWFEWNPHTEEGRTLDREQTVVRYGKPYTKTVKEKDPLPWYTSKSDPRPKIQFQDDGEKFNLYKYELIWMAHHKQPIPDGCVIHHIDFDWTNNNISNLQLMTEEDHRKLHAKAWTNDPKRSKAVVAVDEHNRVVHRFSSTADAHRMYGFNQSAVSKACRGCFHREGNHKYKGLWWYFESEWLAMC